MKPHEAKEIVAVIAAAFPRHPMTAQTCAVYERMVLDLDAAVGMQAAMRAIATGEFPPTIAAIRAAAVEIQHGARRTGIEAWGDIERAMRQVGSYGTPEFDDPLVAEYVARAGWEAVCQTTGNEASDRSQFARWYDTQSERAETDLRAGHALPPARSDGELTAPAEKRGPSRVGDAVAGLLGPREH